MNIQEATNKAMECGGYIIRKEWTTIIKIKPTNSSNCCIVFRRDGKSCRRWEPQAKDLIADDWTVTQE